MTEERRRSTDPWLQELFRQNSEQHSENRDTLNEIKEAITGLAVSRGEQGQKIGVLEKWRDTEVDPTLAMYRQNRDQMKGASKIVLGAATVGGGVIGAMATKIVTAISSIMTGGHHP